MLTAISSTDIGYEKTMSKPLEREQELLKIKKKLEDWASMIPQCVTMQHSQNSPAFRNNGTYCPSPDRFPVNEFADNHSTITPSLLRHTGSPLSSANEPRQDSRQIRSQLLTASLL